MISKVIGSFGAVIGRSLLEGLEVVGEPVEAFFPVLAMGLDPGRGVGERLWFEAAGTVLGVTAAGNEPSLFEHLEVLGDGRKRDVEWRGEFVDRRLALGQAGEDHASGRVGEGVERAVEIGVGCHVYFTNWINNHLVKY